MFRMKMFAMLTMTLATLTGSGAKLSDSVPKGWGEDFEQTKTTAAAEGLNTGIVADE